MKLPNWKNFDRKNLKENISEQIELSKNEIQKILDLDDNLLNFENTILALEKSTQNLEELWTLANHLDSVDNDLTLRNSISKTIPIINEFFSNLSTNTKIFEKINKLEKKLPQKTIEKKIAKDLLLSMKQNGVALEEKEKKKLIKINNELSIATQKYSENVLDSTSKWELFIDKKDEKLLEGLPSFNKEAIKTKSKSKNSSKNKEGFILNLQPPTIIPALKYLKDDELKKTLWEASSKVASEKPYDNSKLVLKILSLRKQKAEILSKENFGDLVLENRMAKNADKAFKFICDLENKIQKSFKQESTELENFKATLLQNKKDKKLYPWQSAYYTEKMRQKICQFDENLLREYFSLENVMNGLFEIAKKYLSLDITEIFPKEKPWSDTVKVYQIKAINPKENSPVLAIFYADWFPSKTKRAGAWMNKLKRGSFNTQTNSFEPHLCTICGNLTAPTKNTPSLLTHDEVCTIFHEAGHLFHFAYMHFCSANLEEVPWDFVELPSLLMENFCWTKKGLDIFAKHYKTGKKIPNALVEKMIKARTFRSGTFFARQLSFAKSDLAIHIKFNEKNSDLEKFVQSQIKNLSPKYKDNFTPSSIMNKFTHIFADPVGYACGYYSYKWAEVLEAGAWNVFEKQGFKKAGKSYVKEILKTGKTIEASKAYKNFTKENMNDKYLLKRENLLNK